MEDNKLLEILLSIQSDMKDMKSVVNGIKSDAYNMKSEVSSLRSDLKDMKSEIIDLKEGQMRIDRKLALINDQTVFLTEFRTEINTKLDKTFTNVEAIKKDIANVEIITSSNWNDIAKLKAVK